MIGRNYDINISTEKLYGKAFTLLRDMTELQFPVSSDSNVAYRSLNIVNFDKVCLILRNTILNLWRRHSLKVNTTDF